MACTFLPKSGSKLVGESLVRHPTKTFVTHLKTPSTFQARRIFKNMCYLQILAHRSVREVHGWNPIDEPSCRWMSLLLCFGGDLPHSVVPHSWLSQFIIIALGGAPPGSRDSASNAGAILHHISAKGQLTLHQCHLSRGVAPQNTEGRPVDYISSRLALSWYNVEAIMYINKSIKYIISNDT